jgi:hypothetical protein
MAEVHVSERRLPIGGAEGEPVVDPLEAAVAALIAVLDAGATPAFGSAARVARLSQRLDQVAIRLDVLEAERERGGRCCGVADCRLQRPLARWTAVLNLRDGEQGRLVATSAAPVVACDACRERVTFADVMPPSIWSRLIESWPPERPLPSYDESTVQWERLQ